MVLLLLLLLRYPNELGYAVLVIGSYSRRLRSIRSLGSRIANPEQMNGKLGCYGPASAELNNHIDSSGQYYLEVPSDG